MKEIAKALVNSQKEMGNALKDIVRLFVMGKIRNLKISY